MPVICAPWPESFAEEVDRREFSQIISGHLLEHACTDKGALDFLNGNIHINYLYFDKSGTELSRFTVTPSDCIR
jgi:hypothetical protein